MGAWSLGKLELVNRTDEPLLVVLSNGWLEESRWARTSVTKSPVLPANRPAPRRPARSANGLQSVSLPS